jgi:hypothetical protein
MSDIPRKYAAGAAGWNFSNELATGEIFMWDSGRFGVMVVAPSFLPGDVSGQNVDLATKVVCVGP